MMQLSVQNAALQLRLWWWFMPPGLAITTLVGSLYVDERRASTRSSTRSCGMYVSLHVDNLRVHYRTLHGDVRALDGVTFASPTARSWAWPASPAAASRRSARA